MTAPHPTPDRRPRTIVVVDDDHDLAETLVMLLEAEGYAASYALSGKTGLALVQSVRPDAVLLDYMLPDMTGGDVGRAIRATPPLNALGILMYTSTPEEVVRPTFDAYDAFLGKPVIHDQLIAALDRVLSPSAPHEQ